MFFSFNGKKISKKTLLKKIQDPKNKITKVTIDLPNESKKKGRVTMEGFDIPADFFVELAKKSTALNGSVTATFRDCDKLGEKTVIITIKDTEPKES